MFPVENYYYSIVLFVRLLGVLYFFVFGAFLFQWKGLFGKEGILPIEHYLKQMEMRLGRKRFYYIPTLFWLNSSDTFIFALMLSGTLVSILLALGFFPVLCLFILILLHLSVISAGQDFLSFGWEGLLVEICWNTFFLILTYPFNPIAWIGLNFLLFRFHFEAGISKLEARDPVWRDLTALQYHYQTQPIPNTLAWYVHKLPLWFHKASTAFMFFVELIIPFLIFGTSELRFFAFLFTAGLQVIIWLTGNFSYLNHMTFAWSIILLSNAYLPNVLQINTPDMPPSGWITTILAYVGAAFLLYLQVTCLVNRFWPKQFFSKLLRALYFFHLGNRYGLFAVMTTKRLEIIVQGSDDGVEWKEYLFKYKPSELERRPKRISPYQPRLDWQAWFLPFSSFEYENWYLNFLYRLLQGSPDVLKLLRYNPFPEKPPKYIRSLMFDYEFSSYAAKKATGRWWERRYLGIYSPTMSLQKEDDASTSSSQDDTTAETSV